jgi:DegV family protein with EDD domain
MNVKIVIDSTADVSDVVKARMAVVPLTVHFGEEEYVDGVTIDHKAFYEKLVESDVLPTTSQATPAAFAEIFERETNAGNALVVVTLASKLSGTYQSAMIAAADYENVYVVDSKTAAIGTGILAKLGLWLADEGLEAAEIAARLHEASDKVCVIAMLDTLEYLKRGGRISKTVAFAGGLLNIKPVVAIRDGEIVMLGKARGSKQGNNLLVKEIEEAGGVDFSKPVMLGYTGLSDDLLRKYMEDSKHLWEDARESLHTTCIGSAIGTHAGPGAVAVAFFKK